MTNTPDSLGSIAQSVVKDQSDGHQAIPAKPQPAPPQRRKSWTGFAGKTLWDWLQFLVQLIGVIAIPLVIFLASNALIVQQNATSQNQLQEDLLKTFRDDINRLVLDQHLLTAKRGDPVQVMAQSYTNDALRKLDLSRRVLLVRFLVDLGLVTNNALISLARVDLSGANLQNAYLSEINLQGVNLQGANLQGARLFQADLRGAEDLQRGYYIGTNLQGANLQGADLNEAYLNEINLQGADLKGAYLRNTILYRVDLRGANLEGANLEEANLSKARVTREQLAKAQKLRDATLPDGSRYPSTSYPIPDHQEPTN